MSNSGNPAGPFDADLPIGAVGSSFREWCPETGIRRGPQNASLPGICPATAPPDRGEQSRRGWGRLCHDSVIFCCPLTQGGNRIHDA